MSVSADTQVFGQVIGSEECRSWRSSLLERSAKNESGGARHPPGGPACSRKVLGAALFGCLGEDGFGFVAPVAFAVVGGALPAGPS